MKVLLIDISNGDDILSFRKTFLSIINVAIRIQLDIDIKIILDTSTVLLSKTTKYLDSAESLIQLSSCELKEVHTKINFSILDLNQTYHYTSNCRYPIITIGIGAELTDDFVLKAISSQNNNFEDISNKYLSDCCCSSSSLNSDIASTKQIIDAKLRQMKMDALMYTDKASEAKLQGREE